MNSGILAVFVLLTVKVKVKDKMERWGVGES
jgi:hypothetical protein